MLLPAACQDCVTDWFELTRALADSERDLADAMQDYRRHPADDAAIRVSQALANREHAKEMVHSLMHVIWQKLF